MQSLVREQWWGGKVLRRCRVLWFSSERTGSDETLTSQLIVSRCKHGDILFLAECE